MEKVDIIQTHLGQNVIFMPHEGHPFYGLNGSKEFSATVSLVHNQDSVNLTVFPPVARDESGKILSSITEEKVPSEKMKQEGKSFFIPIRGITPNRDSLQGRKYQIEDDPGPKHPSLIALEEEAKKQ